MWMVFAIWASILAIAFSRSNYEFDTRVGSYWSLADKTSTLAAKSSYIDQFVDALEKENLHGMHDTIWFEAPDNNFDKNFEALKTLQSRLKQIQTLDPNSLAYQQAIAQITAQEQNQAGHMIGVLYGCWMLRNHPLMWGWILGLDVTLLVLLGIVTLIVSLSAWLDPDR